MFCQYCGSQLPDNADFCGSCGKKVKQIHKKKDVFTGDETVKITPAKSHSPASQPYYKPFEAAQQSPQPAPQENNNQYNPVMQQNNPVIQQNSYYSPQQSNINPQQDIPVANSTVMTHAKPEKKEGAVKTVMIIIIGILVAAICAVATFGITMLIASRPKTPEKEDTTEGVSINSEIDDTIYSDPISYFNSTPDTYYKVSNNPDADRRIFASFGTTSSLGDTLDENELILVYGTFEDWVCFSYDGSYEYAWCKAEAVFKTDEVPTEKPAKPTVNKYDDPITYFEDQPDAYYRVNNTGSEGLHIRTADYTGATPIRILQETELVLVYGIEDGWAYVVTADSRTIPGTYGWCYAEYLSFDHNY